MKKPLNPLLTVLFSSAMFLFMSCPGVEAPPAGGGGSSSIRVHYKRTDGNYAGWGLHLWNLSSSVPAVDRAVETVWASPRIFEGTDEFGVYTDIPVLDIKAGLNFIVHKGEDKEGLGDRTFSRTGEKEFWLISGNPTIYTTNPGKTALKVEISDARTVQAVFSAALSPGDVVLLTEADGTAVDASLVKSGSTAVFTLAQDLKTDRVYRVVLNGLEYAVGYSTAYIRSGALTYSSDDLGALYSSGAVTFKLWSPTAEAVKVQLYSAGDQNLALGAPVPLVRGTAGVWSVKVSPDDLPGITDLDGCFYQYLVTSGGTEKKALDPYARSMAAFLGDRAANTDKVGKGAIVDLQAAAAGKKPLRPGNSALLSSPTGTVIYEVHVRDYTVSNPDVEESLKGTFTGLAASAAHLEELGITHIQLLPVANHFRVNELDRSFQGQVSGPNYNWGYDPHNFFTLEGHYSAAPEDPYARIREFREMVDSLHDRNIGVIMDVVFNHTYSNRVFNDVAPGLYYRPSGGSTPVGEPAVETRNPMVRKFIIDNLKMWVEQYGVDGFRFDLMGFIDNSTMLAIREALGPDIILHGEAWNFTDLPAEDQTVKGNKTFYPYGADVALFNDTIRDAVKGSGENEKQAERGFVHGEGRLGELFAGILAGIDSYEDDSLPEGLLDNKDKYRFFAKEPTDALQILEVHDGFTLWDKLNFTVSGPASQRAKVYNQASALLFTSQGKLLIQAGMEFGRTKPLAANDPEPGRAAAVLNTSAETQDPDLSGVTKFHNNTYSSGDYTNQLRWTRKTSAPFSSINSYYKGLIAMRRGIPAFRYASAANIRSGLKFHVQGAGIPESGTKAGYTSFAEVPSLVLKFINGPENQTYYLVGEVFSSNANPTANPYALTFDAEGRAEVSLNSAALTSMDPDLDVWGDAGDLNFKLVKTKGLWDAVQGAYSDQGNNRLKAANILSDNSITVDLNILNCIPGEYNINSKLVVYELDNTLETAGSATAFTRLLVIHNAGRAASVASELLAEPAGWSVILDDDEAGLTPVTALPEGFSLTAGAVQVPSGVSLVLAK